MEHPLQPQPPSLGLAFNFNVVQINGPTAAQDSIAIGMVISDPLGLIVSVTATQEGMRAMRNALNEALEMAANTLIKPRSELTQA